MSDKERADSEQLYKIRHSAAHVMAEAVLELYPEAKIAIGPPIDTGFYYDFGLGKTEDGKPRTFTPEDLEQISACARSLAGKAPLHLSPGQRRRKQGIFAISPTSWN